MYCDGFSCKRGDRGIQTSQICHVMCRWILPAHAMTISPYSSTAPEHHCCCLALPGPASGSLEIAGQPLGEAEEVQEGWKNPILCKVPLLLQWVWQEKIPRIGTSSCTNQSWEPELKFIKRNEFDLTLWRQHRTALLGCFAGVRQQIQKSDTAKSLYVLINVQGIFMDNRINDHTSTSHGQF